MLSEELIFIGTGFLQSATSSDVGRFVIQEVRR